MPNEVAIAATHEIETRDLEYRRAEDGPLLARLYQPKGSGPFPALVDVHGGAWASGDRLNNAPLDEALAKSGIVVLAIDFRMPPRHRYPVSALGTSSGGHQLLLAVMKPTDARYAAIPLAQDTRIPFVVLCWPISD